MYFFHHILLLLYTFIDDISSPFSIRVDFIYDYYFYVVFPVQMTWLLDHFINLTFIYIRMVFRVHLDVCLNYGIGDDVKHDRNVYYELNVLSSVKCMKLISILKQISIKLTKINRIMSELHAMWKYEL